MFTLRDFKEWFFKNYVKGLQKRYSNQEELSNEDDEEGTEESHI